MKKGRLPTRALRNRLAELFDADGSFVGRKSEIESALHLQSDVEMHLPIQVGDYTDFYSSI